MIFIWISCDFIYDFYLKASPPSAGPWILVTPRVDGERGAFLVTPWGHGEWVLFALGGVARGFHEIKPIQER